MPDDPHIETANSHKRRFFAFRYLRTFAEKVRERGLAYTIRRAVGLLKDAVIGGRQGRVARRIFGGRVPEFSVVNVEVTTFCNLSCAGCQRTIHSEDGAWSNSHISMENFTKLIDDLPTARELIPQGIGEPLLHPQLPELLRYALNSGKFDSITLTSHGMVRDDDDYLQLFDCGLTTLYFSVDATEPKLAQQLRAGTNLDVLMRRIRTLVARFPGRIAIRTTLGTANLDHLPRLLADLNAIGRLDVYIHPYDDIGDAEGCMTTAQRLEVAERLPLLAKQFNNLNVIANGLTPSSETCRWPWQSPSIKVNGEVTPCCRIMYYRDFNFGNAFESSFRDVFYSDETNAWRTRFENKRPEVCQGCPWFVEWGELVQLETPSCVPNST